MDDSGNLSTALTSDPTGGGAAPDLGSGAPSGTGTSSNLGGAIQPNSPAPPQDLPRFQRTFKSTLQGMLLGFERGGVPGAVVGGVDPQGVQRSANASAQLAQAKVTFANAQAAHEVAMAHQADVEYQALPEKLQQQAEERGLKNMEEARKAGYLPVASVPLDQGTEQNSAGATTALNSVKQQFGAVPNGLLYIHTGSGMTVMKLQDPAAALTTINQARRAQGMPEIAQDTFLQLAPADRDSMARDAINFTDPRDTNGQVTQNSINLASMRLATVKAQPQFNGKDALVTSLQQSVDHQKSVLDSGAQAEATRKGQAVGAEATAAQPGQTAAKVREVNATAGPEAAAAGAKAEAVAKGTAKGQLEGSGGAKDANGNWNQASLPVMLVEANADPSQIKNSRSGMSAQQVEQAASQYSMEKYGKPFDMAKAQSDYKFATNTQTQNTLKYLNSLTGSDNKSGNLGALVEQSNKITRTQFPALNDIAAWGRLEAGDPAMASYHAAVTEVSDQIAKILQGGGSGTSDAKMKQAQELFRTGFNKDQITGVADTLRTLLANRKGELIGDNRYLQKQYGGAAAAKPVYASAPGKPRLQSLDGGKTWQPAQAQ